MSERANGAGNQGKNDKFGAVANRIFNIIGEQIHDIKIAENMHQTAMTYHGGDEGYQHGQGADAIFKAWIIIGKKPRRNKTIFKIASGGWLI